MIRIEIYTTRYCPYCHAAKRLLTHKGAELTEVDVSGDPRSRSEMVARAKGRMTVPQIFIGPVHVGGYDDLQRARAGRQARYAARPRRRACKQWGTIGMNQGQAAFTAGLVQMRSGLSPQANLDAALRLIETASDDGAEYVQTPEMTNILEVKRERLFAAIAPEESDESLAAFRERARKLGLFLHVGSLAIKVSPERAANRSFLIDRNGDIVARYDKIHMFDVDLANGESYRKSRSYRPGRNRSCMRSAVGATGAHGLL